MVRISFRDRAAFGICLELSEIAIVFFVQRARLGIRYCMRLIRSQARPTIYGWRHLSSQRQMDG